ncbi:hypothetical protein MMPV_001334 [Pyropia vietnamensis]
MVALVLLAASTSAETQASVVSFAVVVEASDAMPGVVAMAADATSKTNNDNEVNNDGEVDGVSRTSDYHGRGYGSHYKRRWCKHQKKCRKHRVLRYKPCRYYSSRTLEAGGEAAAAAEPEEAAPMQADGVERADGEVLTGASDRSGDYDEKRGEYDGKYGKYGRVHDGGYGKYRKYWKYAGKKYGGTYGKYGRKYGKYIKYGKSGKTYGEYGGNSEQ